MAAVYAICPMPDPGLARNPAVELVMTMQPPAPPARRAESAIEIVFQVPVKLVPMMSPQTAAGSPPSPSRTMPALARTMSTRPSEDIPSSKAFCSPARSRTSAFSARSDLDACVVSRA